MKIFVTFQNFEEMTFLNENFEIIFDVLLFFFEIIMRLSSNTSKFIIENVIYNIIFC